MKISYFDFFSAYLTSRARISVALLIKPKSCACTQNYCREWGCRGRQSVSASVSLDKRALRIGDAIEH